MTSSPLSHTSLLFPSASTSITSTLHTLKRANLTLTNRLHSIHSDAEFVRKVTQHFDLPLIANERCGSWYVPPVVKAGSAYFKSTDGHAGEWAFSLRRLNLQVLEVVRGAAGVKKGCIIVDSTRRGKSMPDALSKTAPIWIAVLNRLFRPERADSHALRTPPNVVSASEHAQIEARIAGFVKDAKWLELDVPVLRRGLKPMRAVWVTPDTDLASVPLLDEEYTTIVLCTASSRSSEASALGAAYVQGAADDSEAWACGLDAVTFWNNAEELLATPEDELPGTIAALTANSVTSVRLPRRISPTQSLALCDNAALSDPRSKLQDYDVIVCMAKELPAPLQGKDFGSKRTVIFLPGGNGKLGSRNLRLQLVKLARFAPPVQKILVTCSTGRDYSVGAALAILCMYFDASGNLVVPRRQPVPSKAEIKKRLSWIMTSIPDVSPTRTTLQSVNAFLMNPDSPCRYPRQNLVLEPSEDEHVSQDHEEVINPPHFPSRPA